MRQPVFRSPLFAFRFPFFCFALSAFLLCAFRFPLSAFLLCAFRFSMFVSGENDYDFTFHFFGGKMVVDFA